ncbi:MAG: hypothetical protein LAC70_00260 [Methylovulum sp.]|nr:hypothetical protein [Methylovulum sp.]
MIQRTMKILLVGMVSTLLSGCATDELFNKKGEEPNKVRQEHDHYVRINQLFSEADKSFKIGDDQQARKGYEEILKLDSANIRAQEALRQLDLHSKHTSAVKDARLLFESGKTDAARLKLRPVLIENPTQVAARALMNEIEAKSAKDLITPVKLKPSHSKTVTLEFRDAGLRNIFEVISKTTGLNFVFDPAVRPDLRASIFVKDVSVEEAIDFLLMMHQMEKKPLSENSLMIYPASKKGQYEDLILRTYYLNFADAKQTVSLIKSMLNISNILVDDKLNMITLKATYNQLKDVEKLIADEDMAEPEVVLDVEVMEVSRNRLTDLGMTFPNQIGLVGMSSKELITLDELRSINSANIGISPLPLINFIRRDSDTNILANPRIRVKNRESAKIHIGDKIPITTSTVSSTGNVVGNSANYLDVGLKLDVQPRVMLNNDVSIKVNLEVSNVKASVAPNGFPTINTRNVSTILLTADGETQVLAGLIQSTDLKSASKIPGIADIPFLGRLFSDENKDRSKTELMLLITPHVVRNIHRPDASNTEFYGGTTGNRTGPLNFNPSAYLQELSGAPNRTTPAVTTMQSPAANSAAPASTNVVPSGSPQPLGQPVGLQ